jgi:enoyl-CoA hydratase
MAVRIEKAGPVWTIIHDRPEARNAMDPDSADALTTAFLEFDADKDASVAVFYGAGGAFCAGWDLKYVSSLNAAYPLGARAARRFREDTVGGLAMLVFEQR